MKFKSIYILIFCFIISSCNNNEDTKYIELFGEKIKLNGNPDQQLITQYVEGEVDYVYPFNTAFTMSVILELPAIYHCFILEQIEDKKQLSYIKIDDGMKFNYIPEYDSLEYDLNYTIVDERLGKLPSSKYDSIPILRSKSEKYNLLISTCNDSQELSDFYNNSLFFQCDTSIIDKDFKENLLNELVKIMLVRYIQSVVDENILYYYKVFLIFHGTEVLGFIDDFSFGFDGIDIRQFLVKEKRQLDHVFYYINFYYKYMGVETDFRKQDKKFSITLGKFCDQIFKDLHNKSSEIYKYFEDGYKIYSIDCKYIIIFKMDFENNKLSIKRNFINHNFLLPPKLIGYNHICSRMADGTDNIAIVVDENGNAQKIPLPHEENETKKNVVPIYDDEYKIIGIGYETIP
ncbi:MAG: hypothetical protein MJ211_00605 [Bacteroidales bacterium]|nr:hypothetical protein [Bacteroidales bacterium]